MGPLKDTDSNVFVDNEVKCEILNNFFASVFTKEDLSNKPEVRKVFNGNTSQELNDIAIASLDVFIKISTLTNGKAPGNDNIIPEFLKEVVDEVCLPLAVIYNLSLRDGQVPLEWKRANVTPLFKNVQRTTRGTIDLLA